MFIKFVRIVFLFLLFLNFTCYARILSEKEKIKQFDDKISFFLGQSYFNEENYLFSKYIFYSLIKNNEIYNKYSYKSKIYLALSKFKRGKTISSRKICKSIMSIKHVLSVKALNYTYFLKACIFCKPSKNFFFSINSYKVDHTFIKKAYHSLSKINTTSIHTSYVSFLEDVMYKVEIEMKKHRLYIANYYFKKGAYISVIKRLHHFNHSCKDKYDYQINYLLIKSYNELYLSDISEKLVHFMPSKYFKQRKKRI